MSKKEKQKLKLLMVKSILEEQTDAEHGITMERIIELLETHGIEAARKSVYDDIDTLITDLGMDIQKPLGKNHTYRLKSRTFSVAELKLIVDSVQASKFLSVGTSREIIRKMGTLCSKHEAQQLRRGVILTSRVKNMEDMITGNVSSINSAINDGEQISFKYFD